MTLHLPSPVTLFAVPMLLFASAGCGGEREALEVAATSSALCVAPNPPVPFTSVTFSASCNGQVRCEESVDAPTGVAAVRILQPLSVDKVHFSAETFSCPGGDCLCGARTLRGRLWQRNAITGCWSYVGEKYAYGQPEYGLCRMSEVGWIMATPAPPNDQLVVQLVETWGGPVNDTFEVAVYHYTLSDGGPILR